MRNSIQNHALRTLVLGCGLLFYLGILLGLIPVNIYSGIVGVIVFYIFYRNSNRF